MAVPKKKTSRRNRGNRRSHDALQAPGLSIDKQTKSVHRPHHIDLKTGYYRGKQVLFNETEDDGAADAED